MPASFYYHEYIPETVDRQLPSLDLFQVGDEDLRIERETGRTLYGRVIPTSADLLEEGVWTTLPDGSRICRMSFHSEGALGLTVYFSQFYLPDGASLFAYGEEDNYWVGPINFEENNPHLQFKTSQVFGDKVTIEYHEPLGVTGQPLLEIRGVGNLYRYVYKPEWIDDERGSEDCQVNVLCPEGDEWEDEINSVVRLEVTDGGNIGLCTGVLMNNTAWDYRQLMLTALHCTEGVSDNDLAVMEVRFNYERQNCEGTGGFPNGRNKIGVIHLGDSDCGGGTYGSDYAIFEIEDYINDNWDPYFAGWRSNNFGGISGVGIHHPSGDVKKISTYNSTLLNGTWVFETNAHWRVRWASTETDWGVTEGGSSGSPLFDADHYVIGTLTGGGSFCDNPTSRDFYGKMSRHFSNLNPNDPEDLIGNFLDPLGSEQTNLQGTYRGGSPTNINEEESLQKVKVYPNPSSGIITIVLENADELEAFELHDNVGKLIATDRIASDQFNYDLTSLPVGLYYLTLLNEQGNKVTRKITRY